MMDDLDNPISKIVKILQSMLLPSSQVHSLNDIISGGKTISQANCDRLIIEIFSNLHHHDDYEQRMVLLKTIEIILHIKGISTNPRTISMADISLLFKLILSPIEELALKSLKVIAAYANDILFLNYGIIPKLLSAMYSGKSVLFLKGLIYTLNKCLHYHFSVDYQEYCLALRDNIIDLTSIISTLLQSNDIKIYREIIQVLRLLFIEKGDILSSSIIDNASRYSDGKVMEAFNTTPIICIFEIVASQSPHLRIAGLGFLDVLMSQRKDHQEVKILIGLKLIPVLKAILLNNTCEFDVITNTLKLLINVIRVNSRLLQGVIDHDVFSVLLRGMPRISKYRNILITRTIACAARSATASQIKQIAENHYVIQHLFETLMTNEEYEILGPTIQGIADLVKKSKQSPELFENNKAKVLPKLEMIRIEFSQHSTVLQPANQLVRLLNLKSKKK